MRRTAVPFFFILAGVAVIVFHGYIADNTVRTYKMFRIPLIIRDMPYYWIAIGVFVIFVGTFFLVDAIGRF